MRAAINQLINAGLCAQPVLNSFNHSPPQYSMSNDTLQMITYVLVWGRIFFSEYIGVGNGNILQYSWLENPMDRGDS